MRKVLVQTIAASALSLAACGQNGAGPAGEASAKADPKPSEAAEIADGMTGVSSDGRTYTAATNVDSASATAASTGSGAMDKTVTTESLVEFERIKALRPLGSPFGEEIIHGTDDRTKVTNTTTYPERAQVLIVLPGGRCSGAMVGPNLVLTAGHCVHTGGTSGAWVRSAVVYPGRNGSAAPFGSCSGRKFYSVLGWTRDKNAGYDIGAIKLNCSIGSRTGWLGVFSQASLLNIQARISSYPGDKPLEQWTHSDKVRWQSDLQSGYMTDTVPGNSGSGVFAQSGMPAGCGGPCVHTVHAYGATDMNRGTRLRKPLIDNIVLWKAEP